jgi:outer membrane lipoprotein SlyB
MRAAIAVVAAALLAAGCTHPTSNTYDTSDVGRPIAVSEATVVSSRIVDIHQKPSGVGPAAGLAAGAATGATTIGSGSGSVVAGVLGALIGAGVGYVAEEAVTGRKGIEYTLQAPDGHVYTLVQNKDATEEPLPAGTRVLVQTGASYTRIVPRPENLQGIATTPPAPAAVPAPAPPQQGTVRPLSS